MPNTTSDPTAAPRHDPRWLQARELVLRYGWNAMSYQILNLGMRFWFSQTNDAVIGYVEAGGYRVVAGAPICAPAELPAVAQAFAAETRRQHLRVCYFGAQDRLLTALSEHGQTARLLLGAQPVWQPQRWPEIMAGRSSLRAQVSRARNKQVSVTRWPASRATNHPALRRCLLLWLRSRGLPPLHFLVESDTLAQLEDRLVLVAERADAVVGFLVASPVPLRNGWLVEQIVRLPGAPNGTNELLLDAAMRACAEAGAEYLTLGLSPLSRHGRADETVQPVWTRTLLRLVRAHGRRFYNFDGLDAFKIKFQPESWEPIYAISEERWTSLRTIYAIAGAFSGRSPLLFIAEALTRAAAQELRRAVK